MWVTPKNVYKLFVVPVRNPANSKIPISLGSVWSVGFWVLKSLLCKLQMNST